MKGWKEGFRCHPEVGKGGNRGKGKTGGEKDI
jgi:hypothetical protein